jgi:hypothetical protein
MRNLSPLKISELFSLQYEFWSSAPELSRNGGVPYPDTNHVVYAQNPTGQATVLLYEGTLRYYPLKLSQIVLGNGLGAYFNCHLPRPASRIDVRYGREDLIQEQKFLLHELKTTDFESSIIPAWNRAQVTAAIHLMDLVPEPQRTGVPDYVMNGFLGHPTNFEKSMARWGVYKPF